MSVSHRLAALAVAMSALVPITADAADDFTAASSRAPTQIVLCGNGDGARIKTAACKEAGYDKQVAQIDKAFATALAKTPANIRPLLKRDQVWFNEIITEAADSLPQSDDDETKESFAETLTRRVTLLEAIARGFGRPGFAGKWVNTFGSVVVTPADGGTYRLAIDTSAVYGTGSDRRRECRINALVKPGFGAWLTGTMLPDETKPAKPSGDDKVTAVSTASESAKPTSIKIRRQGETLRIVLGDEEWRDEDHPDCEYRWQITASYFASGKPEAATDRADTPFVAPTFDCSRPETATDEEICADPDLAENDQRLNRAWKALLPRLDEATRRALMEDQRGWVRTQAHQYPQFLHPAWEKQTSQMHFTSNARERLDLLQCERIALLEGFDDKRDGLAGVWLASNAVIKVTANEDGSLKAEGWKWEQGDWKAGCDYDMAGKLVGSAFRSDDQRKNPDTLERDHAMLIVNRQDDVFAKKREGRADDDDAKCRRRLDHSSTARLFPARPSPDIDNLGGASIR